MHQKDFKAQQNIKILKTPKPQSLVIKRSRHSKPRGTANPGSAGSLITRYEIGAQQLTGRREDREKVLLTTTYTATFVGTATWGRWGQSNLP
jgi:hypothetical protein